MHHSFKDQLSVEIKSVIYGYPKFVFSGNDEINLDGIPVFVYHTIDPELFESQLIYLKANSYKTLSIHEFYDIMVNSRSANYKKSVLLTIDDARSSVWRFAHPLLKKYEMNATVFIIPGWTKDSSEKRKNLFDVWEGKNEREEIDSADPSDRTLCTWQEIKEMYRSGLINIESHTLFHREAFRNTNIVGFFSKDSSIVSYNFSASPYLKLSDIKRDIKVQDYFGLPLFQASPLLLAGHKINISDEFIVFCKELYNQNNSWKDEIKKVLKEPLEIKKYFESEPDSQKDILEDLQIAKSLIRENLDFNAGNHLCLPWTIGSREAINIAKELEIKSCFWGVQFNKRINKPGDNPYFISRIKNDFIFRLPGIKRKNLFSIYNYKLKRRISGEKPF